MCIYIYIYIYKTYTHTHICMSLHPHVSPLPTIIRKRSMIRFTVERPRVKSVLNDQLLSASEMSPYRSYLVHIVSCCLYERRSLPSPLRQPLARVAIPGDSSNPLVVPRTRVGREIPYCEASHIVHSFIISCLYFPYVFRERTKTRERERERERERGREKEHDPYLYS